MASRCERKPIRQDRRAAPRNPEVVSNSPRPWRMNAVVSPDDIVHCVSHAMARQPMQVRVRDGAIQTTGAREANRHALLE